LRCELRIPSEEEIEQALNATIVEEDGFLSYDEFLTVLFKSTQDWSVFLLDYFSNYLQN